MFSVLRDLGADFGVTDAIEGVMKPAVDVFLGPFIKDVTKIESDPIGGTVDLAIDMADVAIGSYAGPDYTIAKFQAQTATGVRPADQVKRNVHAGFRAVGLEHDGKVGPGRPEKFLWHEPAKPKKKFNPRKLVKEHGFVPVVSEPTGPLSTETAAGRSNVAVVAVGAFALFFAVVGSM